MYGILFTGITLTTWIGFLVVGFLANSNSDWDVIFVGSGIAIFLFGIYAYFTNFVTNDYSSKSEKI